MKLSRGKLSAGKTFALLLCACLIAASLLYIAALTLHACRDCVGDGCEVCHYLARSGWGRARWNTFPFSALAAIGAGVLFARLICGELPAVFGTPVALHVRLNH